MLLSIVAVLGRPSSLAEVQRLLGRFSRGRAMSLLLSVVVLLVVVQFQYTTSLSGHDLVVQDSSPLLWILAYVAVYGTWLLLPFVHLTAIRLTGTRAQAFMAVAMSLTLPVVSSLLFAWVFPLVSFRIVDSDYSRYYLQGLPGCIRTLSEGRGGSFIPIAASPFGEGSGRNDGILSVTELPNLYSGRTFFQWRHSYPVVTSEMYGRVTKSGHQAGLEVDFFPPGQSSVDRISRLADYTRSDYIYSIDLPLDNGSFELLGTCRYRGESGVSTSPKIRDRERQQLLGEVYLYERTSSTGLSGLGDFKYSKLGVHVTDFGGLDEISVPIVYSPTLVAESLGGRSINVSRDQDGLVVLRGLTIEDGEVFITSVSWLRLVPFLIVFLVIGTGEVIRRRYGER